MIRVCGHRVLIKVFDVADIDPAYEAAKRMGMELLKDHLKVEQNAVDRGTVVQMGTTAYSDFGDGSRWCDVGDEVIFSKYAGKKIKDPYTEEEYVICNDEDVVCVIGKDQDE